MDSLTCDEEVDDAAADGAGADLALVLPAVGLLHTDHSSLPLSNFTEQLLCKVNGNGRLRV